MDPNGRFSNCNDFQRVELFEAGRRRVSSRPQPNSIGFQRRVCPQPALHLRLRPQQRMQQDIVVSDFVAAPSRISIFYGRESSPKLESQRLIDSSKVNIESHRNFTAEKVE